MAQTSEHFKLPFIGMRVSISAHPYKIHILFLPRWPSIFLSPFLTVSNPLTADFFQVWNVSCKEFRLSFNWLPCTQIHQYIYSGRYQQGYLALVIELLSHLRVCDVIVLLNKKHLFLQFSFK